MLYDGDSAWYNSSLLAETFIELLRSELSADELKNLYSLSETEIEDVICHSDEWVDADSLMIDAFEKCFPGIDIDYDEDECTELVNSAWSMIKEQNFGKEDVF